MLPLIGCGLTFAGHEAFGLIAALLYQVIEKPVLPWSGSDSIDWRWAFLLAGLVMLLFQAMFYRTSRWLQRKVGWLNNWDAVLMANPLTCGAGVLLAFLLLPEMPQFELRQSLYVLVIFASPGCWNQARLGIHSASWLTALWQGVLYVAVVTGAGIWRAITLACCA